MSVKSFRDLRVWQAGMNLAAEVYSITQDPNASCAILDQASALSKQFYALRNAVARSHTANPQPQSPNPQ